MSKNPPGVASRTDKQRYNGVFPYLSTNLNRTNSLAKEFSFIVRNSTRIPDEVAQKEDMIYRRHAKRSASIRDLSAGTENITLKALSNGINGTDPNKSHIKHCDWSEIDDHVILETNQERRLNSNTNKRQPRTLNEQNGSTRPDSVAKESNISSQNNYRDVIPRPVTIVPRTMSCHDISGRDSQRSLDKLPLDTHLPPIEHQYGWVTKKPGEEEDVMSYRHSTTAIHRMHADESRQPRLHHQDSIVSNSESLIGHDSSSAAYKRRRRRKVSERERLKATLDAPLTKSVSAVDISSQQQSSQYDTPTSRDRQHNSKNAKQEYKEDRKRYLAEEQTAKQTEPFSIRKKIEEFKKWREEQNGHATAVQKSDSPSEKNDRADNDMLQSIIEGEENHIMSRETSNTLIKETILEVSKPSAQQASQPGTVNLRGKSAGTTRTWKTWRDANDSYAYRNVKKYIDENELLSPEKEEWIRNWIIQVDREFFANKVESAAESDESRC